MADALSRLPTNGTQSKPMKEKFPVLVIASGEEMSDATTVIFQLEEHTDTRAYSETNADGTNATSQTLPESETAQSADKFYEKAVWELGQAETELTLNKEEVLVRGASLDGALQYLVPKAL